MDSPGRVIVLNGTSSSGKSTLLRALQARLSGAWLGVGIDTVVFALPSAYLDQPRWSEVFRYVPAEPGSAAPYRIETGELGHRLVDGLHRMVAALADVGLPVIVDHVLLEPGWLPDLVARLEGHDLLLVGVRCPLDVVVERERARRDRTLGQAAAQFDVVHRGLVYDLEVDSSVMAPGPAADVIAGVVESGLPGGELALLRHAGTLFEIDGDDRLVRVNEPDGDPPPLVFVARGTRAVRAWFSAGAPDAVVEAGLAAARRLPRWDGREPGPDLYAALAAAVLPGSTGVVEGGPAFAFGPPSAVADTGVVRIGASNAHLLDRHFPYTRANLDRRAPVVGVVRDGAVVAACYASRRGRGEREAGVDTLEAYRGQGFATALVSAWRDAVEAEGAVPLYSTDWGNGASLALARRLGLVAYADTWSIRGRDD